MVNECSLFVTCYCGNIQGTVVVHVVVLYYSEVGGADKPVKHKAYAV